MNLPQPLVPHQPQLRVLLLQLPQLAQGDHGVAARGQNDLIGQGRLQHRGGRGGFGAQPLARLGLGQAGDGAEAARLRRLHSLVFRAGIDADLLGLFLPGPLSGAAGQKVFDPQTAAGDFHIGQPGALGVPGDFIDFGGKFLGIDRRAGIGFQPPQQLLHPVQPQSGAKIAGEQLPPSDHILYAPGAHRPLLQIFLHGLFAAQGQVFHPIFPRLRAKIHAGRVQLAAELLQQRRPAVGRQIHFVDKQKDGNLIPAQQPPQGVGMGLDAVCGADHQDGAVHHLEGPFHLAGKIHMARGVQQGDFQLLQGQNRLLGEDGDPPLPLLGVRIQKGVLMVYPAQFFQLTAAIEHPLGQSGLARVHMGQNARRQSFHLPFPAFIRFLNLF